MCINDQTRVDLPGPTVEGGPVTVTASRDFVSSYGMFLAR